MIKNTLELAAFGPVIPVIVLQRVEHAVPMARALLAGGVRVLEVTLRTPVALACMQAIAREVPQAIVGAGTLRSAADVRAARDAGCQFGVSPGYTTEIGSACRAAQLPLLPVELDGVRPTQGGTLPRVGQHTNETLRVLGVSDADIERLKSENVIQ